MCSATKKGPGLFCRNGPKGAAHKTNQVPFSVDPEDQRRFAELSGDHNPLHLDPVTSRRLLFGGPVVHGVHLVLWALDRLAARLPEPAVLAKLGAVFRRPLPLEAPVSLEIEEAGEGGFRAEFGGGHCELSGRLATSADPRAWAVELPDGEAPRECRELTFRQASHDEGQIPLYLDRSELRRMFPRVAERLPAVQVAAILATTRLTGMVCPGLHTVFDSLELRFAEPEKGSWFVLPERPGGCFAQNKPGPFFLEYRVEHGDERFSTISLAVEGGGAEGLLKTFFRPPPVAQPSCGEVAAVVEPGEFRAQRALVVGGSRGLGELTAKIVAAGGGIVRITYHRGKDDAERVTNEILKAGGNCEACELDLGGALSEQIARQLRARAPTHVYYFATPHVGSLCGREGFSPTGFRRLCAFYVEGFAALVEALDPSPASPLSLFYPSSAQVGAPERGAAEYAAAKAAGEVLCAALGKRPGVARVHAPRLPRMKTDQTASIGPQRYANALEVMLREIRRLDGPSGSR